MPAVDIHWDLVKRALEMPQGLPSLDALAAELGPEATAELCSSLDGLVQHATMVSRFMEQRAGGKAADTAIRRANKVVTGVRRALGYLYP